MRELASIFDEATTFFGIWARQGSQLNARASEANALQTARHAPSLEAARVGEERFTSKLHIAEELVVEGEFLLGAAPWLARSSNSRRTSMPCRSPRRVRASRAGMSAMGSALRLARTRKRCERSRSGSRRKPPKLRERARRPWRLAAPR